MSDRREDPWRDARFKKALDSAPDLAERPADAVREAILSKARATAAQAAAAKAAPQRKRNAWWSLGLPWNSALGTVAVVCLVSVLWWREELPRQADEAAPAPAPTKLEPKPEAAARDQVEAKAKAQAEADAVRRERAAESEKKLQRPRPTLDSAAPALKPIQPPVVQEVSPPSPAPMVAIVPAPAAPAKATVAAPPPLQANIAASMQAPALPPPAPAAVAVPAPAAEPKATVARRSSDAVLETITVTGQRIAAVVAWTKLRVRTSAGPVLLANDELSASGQILLQQQLREQRELRYSADRSTASGAVTSAPTRPPGLVVEVLDGDQLVGQLVLTEGELRQQLEAALASKPR